MPEQTHASEGGAEELGLELPRAAHEATVRDAQQELAHVAADAAGAVVVLAVDVGGHHAAQRHLLGARRHRREPAAREQQPVQLAQREPRLGTQETARGIEGEDAVGEPRACELHAPGRRQRRVAVGPSEPARQHRAAR